MVELGFCHLIVVQAAHERNRRLLLTFQTSLRYALTFPCGESLYSVLTFRYLSRHLALWYPELHSGLYLF